MCLSCTIVDFLFIFICRHSSTHIGITRIYFCFVMRLAWYLFLVRESRICCGNVRHYLVASKCIYQEDDVFAANALVFNDFLFNDCLNKAVRIYSILSFYIYGPSESERKTRKKVFTFASPISEL